MSGWRLVKCCGWWLAALLCGCDGVDAERLESELAAKADSLPVVEVMDVAADELPMPAAYLHAAGRSPFYLDGSVDVPVGASEQEYSALQQYPLEMLTLRGILVQGDERWALMASPDGRLHRLGMAQHMGRAGWRVTDVGVQSVTLVASDAADDHASASRVLWLGGAGRE
ncbi:pilus assembly protein PilP [Halomonas huangheensis]|uniref:Pilus assembly protein PilP n=1 Tax=Halomonas huangheensis TaxID=1178482 RepID=W1N2Y8_9GAMM|nr:pilus assembly protein PilP [Halomonas huangheensis]ALM51401.1 hypothetical protein AR456_03150 [Halomonas huangheensis]ERL49849.1 hypothetical protein BJB45_01630 [Halomonas huangheensis]